MLILAVDIGTTALKMGVYREADRTLSEIDLFSKPFAIRTYNDGLFSDIEPDKWREAFIDGCRFLAPRLPDVDAIALSGTTPGLTAMDADGNALYPAILMLDQRSRGQAQRITDTIGMQTLLETTANMPVAGGCSLASILWIKDNHPDLFAKTHIFGHSNTYIARWLTGSCAIDPSSASLTALYNTVRNDMTWNMDIASAFGISPDRLPRILPSHHSTGRVTDSLAAMLGLRKSPPVVIGGNDAVLAAYSLGINQAGDIVNVNGTCEITLVCLSRCLPSTQYNIRAHVLADRWLTLHVMNAGGMALEWFRGLFCNEMDSEPFYTEFLTRAIDLWLDRDSAVTYVPYLMGSRYSLEPLKAEFRGLTHETTREELLAAMIRGLCEYQKQHLDGIRVQQSLANAIHVTGGAVTPALIRAKKRWIRDCEYIHQEQSSLRGAALLGLKYLTQAEPPVEFIAPPANARET